MELRLRRRHASRKREMTRPALYLWIPRTAGTSLWDACERHNAGTQRIGAVKGRRFAPHCRVTTFQHCYVPSFLEEGMFTRKWLDAQFKFAVVRNPWARLVSVFHHLRQGRKNQQEALCGMDWLAFCNVVCLGVRVEPPGRRTPYLSYACPQTAWLRWPDGSWIPDYVGKFGHIQASWEYVKHCTGLKGKLLHFNHSQHTPYTDYYTADLRRLVALVYEEEIDIWGFSFYDEAKP